MLSVYKDNPIKASILTLTDFDSCI